jgi:Spy/CpxP family protein refolding chaperone
MKKLVILLALMLPAASFAADSAPASMPPPPGDQVFPYHEMSPELLKLHHEIAAARLDKLLDLSRTQAAQLLPLIKQAQQVLEQGKADRKQRIPQIVQALTAVRDDILRTGVVSEASQKALRDAHGDKQQHQEFRQKLMALRDQGLRVLTADQRARLTKFSLRFLDHPGEFGPDGGSAQHDRPQTDKMGHHRGPMEHAAMLVVLSSEFQSLLETRAR